MLKKHNGTLAIFSFILLMVSCISIVHSQSPIDFHGGVGGTIKMNTDGSNASATVTFPDLIKTANATVSGQLDVVGTFTLKGVDVFGDINAALEEILGE
jgi:hypothetical protein